MKNVIALDLDGVCCEFCYAFTTVAAMQKLVQRPWTNYAQETWHFDFHVDPVWAAIDKDDSFWYDLRPLISGAEIGSLRAYADRGYQFIYVTKRRETNKTALQTKRWLWDHNMPDGHLFLNPDSKLDILLPLKASLRVVVDDSPAQLEEMRTAGLPIVARDWKYNRHVDVPRISNMHELEEYL